MKKKVLVGMGLVFGLCIILAIIGSLAGGGNQAKPATTAQAATATVPAAAATIKPISEATIALAAVQPTNTPATPPTATNVPPTATKVPPTATVQPTNTSVPTATPAPLIFSGRGKQATSLFNLSSGLAIFRMMHNGSSNFSVWLMDDTGRKIDLLANVIGSYNGAAALGITKAGRYILDITADGAWSINAEQPLVSSAPGVPQSFTGHGSQVSPMFSLSAGLTIVKMSHSGESNFSVWLLDNKGNRQDLLANEIGQFDGSKAVGISKTGVYLLGITADGSWSITLNQ